MIDLEKLLISSDTVLRDVVKALDETGVHITLVVDGAWRLLGTVTDGDIRRAILSGVTMEQKAEVIMNRSPIVKTDKTTRDELIQTMTYHQIEQLPIVDDERRILRLETLSHLVQQTMQTRPNWVVLMAGGLGTRLRPLTENTPKPLLEVGDQPILEKIINQCVRQNFKRFYISVNYKAEMIMDHFGDGSSFGIEIRYLKEEQRMGTAGALSLIEERPKSPLIVMNADLLTDIDLGKLLNYHTEHDAQATMCVREYDFQVPFGVVRTNGHAVTGIDEKPVHKFFVNAGIYALEPEILDMLDSGASLDMPDLFTRLFENGLSASAFPVIERWIDIGRIEDYKRANLES